MDEQLLREEKIFPNNSVLSNSLGKAKDAYDEFISSVTNDVFRLAQEWHYYHDGKAWLSKITDKKKTVCWLSVWNGFFKVAFYFTEKTTQGVYALDIDKKIKNKIKETKNIGKLIPVVMVVKHKKLISDLLKLVKYKIELK